MCKIARKPSLRAGDSVRTPLRYGYRNSPSSDVLRTSEVARRLRRRLDKEKARR
ncbi:MAG: hypothetical protein IJ493_08610 [Clostridia bacterium]|nr:hypothetical protein [Clostridia bacterium]